MLLPEQARDASRLFERAGLDVPVTAVYPDHESVLALGRSGEPIVVREPEPPALRSSAPRNPRRNQGGRSRNQGRRSTRAPAA
jgi:hypothetical protein